MAWRVPAELLVGSVEARSISAADLGELCAMHADEVVMATLGGVRTRSATQRYVERNTEHWQRYGFGIYCLRDRETQRFIGRAGLRWVSIAGTDEIEVAYALRTEAWGRGLATALCIELVGLAQSAELADDLVAFTLLSNRRSRRVMEKAGFVYARDFEHGGAAHVLYRRGLSAPDGVGCRGPVIRGLDPPSGT